MDVNRVRIHWIPYFVLMTHITEAFEACGLRVSATFDKSTLAGMENVCSLLRTVSTETDQPQAIQHFLDLEFDRTRGQALATTTGRPPLCLKLTGHVRRECDTPYCR